VGSPRRVGVSGERVERWVATFVGRHSPVDVTVTPERVEFVGGDGATAVAQVPYPPLTPAHEQALTGFQPEAAAGLLAAHALAPRTLGVLLVRRGGYAAGIFEGGQLHGAKTGSRHVQGRTAAGGWSQQRFARRREGQARVARDAAADAAVQVLLPETARLDAVVVGGDRRSCDLVLEDPRLRALRPLVSAHRLDVPEPRRSVLEDCAEALRTVWILVEDPTR